jgi:pyruvate formate lyase activating enzyme
LPDSLSGMIFDVRRFSVHDGPGIRTTIFFKGCPLSCWWCHNPESQALQTGVMLRETRCIACGACVEKCPEGAIARSAGRVTTDLDRCTRCGTCVPACPADARQVVGQETTLEHLVHQIERDIPFFEESGGGVTFSGGEPLLQPRFLEALLLACKEREVHTAVDTSGYANWLTLQRLAPVTGLFLYDLKLIDEAQHQRYTGVSNRLILSNLEKLSASGAAIILRFPVIPGITDTPHNLDGIATLARSLPGVQEIDILPYHRAALGKYSRLALDYRLEDIEPPSADHMAGIAHFLRVSNQQNKDLLVRIGG